MKPFCPTRFIESHTNVFDFLLLYDAVVDFFRKEDLSIYNGIINATFLVTAHILQTVLGETKGLSVVLQGKAINLVTATEEVDRVVRRLSQWRSDVENKRFKELFTKAETSFVKHNGFSIPLPRAGTNKRQNHASNAPVS